MHAKLSSSLLLLSCAALLVLSGCRPAETQETTAAPSPSLEAAPTPTPVSTPTPEPAPTPEPSPAFPLYEFGVPLEESGPVEDDSFFENAVFLGDSRTEGLQLFGGLGAGTFYWARGMSVFRADSEDYRLFEVDGEKLTMMEALAKGSYDKVYIMIGVNELGYPVESYEKGLSELLDKAIAAQPEAVIYLQMMPPLNDPMCRANKLGSYLNNENLSRFNEAVVRMAAEKRVVLLNTAEVYTGEDGQLPQELANDGCHFAYSAYSLWADYLRCHTIDPDRYFYCRALDQ